MNFEEDITVGSGSRHGVSADIPSQTNGNETAEAVEEEVVVEEEEDGDDMEPLMVVPSVPLLPESSRHMAFLGAGAADSEITALRSTVIRLREELAKSEQQRLSLRNDIEQSIRVEVESAVLRQTQVIQQQQQQQQIISSTSTTISASARTTTIMGGNPTETVLPQDTFSFILVCNAFSTPYAFGILVYVFQMTTFALVTLDMTRQGDGGGGSSNNPLGIPANVSPELRTAQFIAILVAVFTQGDLMTAFEAFRDGYNERFPLLFESVAYWKFCLSLIARMSEGCVGLVVSFLLIITADTVVNLLLNFTAIEFVSNLDEVLFFLSRQGFMGKSCKKAASLIQKTTYQVSKIHGRAWKAIMLLVILSSMLIGWVVVFQKQAAGVYFCKTLRIQFGDDFVPELGTFSGLYDLKTKSHSVFSSSRVEYVERRSIIVEKSQIPKFAYCTDIGAWTFGWGDGQQGTGTDNSVYDPCMSWFARSSQIDTFDITDTSTLAWHARDSNTREIELNPFHLSCFLECESEDDCGGSMRGSCSDGVCSCKEPWTGRQCEFQGCSDLSVDSQTEPFASTRDWPSEYRYLHDKDGAVVEAYNRPVFFHDDIENNFDIIVFMGRRWALTSVHALPMGMTAESYSAAKISRDELAEFIKNGFHGHSNLFVHFVSEPVDIETPKDSATPVDLQWFRAPISNLNKRWNLVPDKPISTRLLCSICNNSSNPCQYDGVCLDGSCVCSAGASGVRCQGPPTGNGLCQEYYNTAQFEFDGGDCCAQTCHSSPGFTCGYDAFGVVFSGYPSCSELIKNSWHPHGDMIVGPPFSLSGSQVVVSSTGSILAILEPGINQVRLFDMDGSQWIERSAVPRDPEMTIHHIGISSGQGQLLNTQTFLAPVLIGLSGTNSSGSSLTSIYYCVIESCTHLKTTGSVGNVTISGDGSTAAVGLEVYKFSKKQLQLRERLNLSMMDFGVTPSPAQRLNSPDDKILFVNGMSNDGKHLAISLMVFSENCYGVSYPLSCEAITSSMTLSWNGSTYLDQMLPIFNLTFSAPKETASPRISMTGDATLLLATFDFFAPARTKSFVWNRTNWVERFDDIPSYCHDPKMSTNGMTMVCDTEDGNVTVLDWNGISWDQVDHSLQGPGSGPVSVSVSADASVLVVGWPKSEIKDAGGTAVYSRNKRLGSNESVLRLSFTPDIFGTSWYIQSNKTGETIMEDQISAAWEIAAGTETKIVARDDCMVFTIYPAKPLCVHSFIYGEEDCPPPSSPYALNPARFDLFLDEDHVAGKQYTLDNPYKQGCGREVYPPSRVWLGNCAECPGNASRVQVMVQACMPLQWNITDSQGESVASSSILESSSELEEPVWDWVCLDVERYCYNFSIASSRRGIRRALKQNTTNQQRDRKLQAGWEQANWFVTVMVGEDAIASRIDYSSGRVRKETIGEFGNCSHSVTNHESHNNG